MAIHSTHCHVLPGHVSVVTDFEGTISRVICPFYLQPSGVCRLKSDAATGGPLSQFLDRVSEATLDQRGIRCDVA